MASSRVSSSFPVTKEGQLYVVREAGTLSLRRFKCKGRYFVLRGKFAYIYKKAPKAESDAKENVRRGYMGPHVRLAEAGRIMAGGNPLYIFKIYSAIDHKKELTIGALTPEAVHEWMSALQSAIDSVGPVRLVHSTRVSTAAPVVEDSLTPRNIARFSEPGPRAGNGVSPRRVERAEEGRSQEMELVESESPVGKAPAMLRKHTRRKDSYGRGIPEYFKDWTESEIAHAGHGEILDAMERESEAASGMSWRLIRCSNGLRFFEQIHDSEDENNTRTVKSIGIVDAPADKVFALVMSMGKLRLEWDAVVKEGKVVEEIDGHTDVIYKKLRKDWHRGLARSRDLLISRYWRRTEDGRYEILYFPARHRDFPKKFGVVRVKVVSGGFVISPIAPAPGTSSPRCIVEHVLEMKPHGVSCCCGQAGPTYRERLHFMMLNRVAGIRELFAIKLAKPPAPVSASRTRSIEHTHTKDDSRELFVKMPSNAFEFGESEDSETASPTGRSFPFADLLEDDTDDEDDFFDATNELTEAQTALKRQLTQRRLSGKALSTPEDATELRRNAPYSFVSDPRHVVPIPVDFGSFVGTLGRGPEENGKDSWSEPAGQLFKVRGANYLKDRQKVMAGEPICRLVATDWYKSNKKMDALASRPGNKIMQAFHEANNADGTSRGLFMFVINMQVPGPTNYSMVFYFLCDKPIEEGSLLHRFIHGDDAFRNRRFKLIPSIVKGSWVVKQSVGSTACLLGNALTMTYVRGKDNLEFEVNIGSSMVANGIMGMVVGYITHLVVDMAFLVQGDTPEELPEQLLGAVRISRLQLTSAVDPPPVDEA